MIYFDNAATTFPKPPSVVKAVTNYLKKCGGNPGRSSHPLSMAAAEAVYRVRGKIADFFEGQREENVIFTENCTHALNLALQGILEKGDHVLISDLEHNSVLRTVSHFAEKGDITYSVFHGLQGGETLLSELDTLVQANTKALVCAHASNICPNLLPLGKIGAFCQKRGILFVVDAAQSAGIYDISMKRDGISILCAPGHKGLYGPQGSGFALFADHFDFANLKPTLFGGNGQKSRERTMGHTPPESYEAGTLQVPSLVGLGAGIDFVNKVGRETIRKKEKILYEKMKEGLLLLPGVQVYLPEKEEGSLLLCNKEGKTASELSSVLAQKNICTRAGLHCAPTAHDALQTGGDALRISFSYFNTEKEVDTFLQIFSTL